MDENYFLNAAWELLFHEFEGWLDDVWHFRWTEAEYHWFMVGLYISSIAELLIEKIEVKANAVVSDIEYWATGVIGDIEEGATTIVGRISNLWDSVVSVWATFGANLLTMGLTVEDWVERAFDTSWEYVSQHWKDAIADITFFYNWVIDWGNAASTWVNDNGTKVWNWIRDNAATVWNWIRDNSATVWNWIRDNSATVWDWIRDNSATVWDWIRDHASDFSDWLTGTGAPMETLYDKVKVWLEDLYDTHRDRLATFLDDPKKYILDYVKEWYAGIPDEPPPDWLDFLKKLFADPVGTLLAYFEKSHALVADWIMKWLQENFASLDEIIASIVPPDQGLPTVEDWNKGLREPETDEEKAYVALLDTKLQQILDENIQDKPLTDAEFSFLLWGTTGGAET